MNCPKCNDELEVGNLKLRCSHKSRVIYSPINIEDNLIDKWLPGSIFDNKLKNGEVELLNASPMKKNKIFRRSYYCKRCKMFLIFKNE
jgi:hypothetical protein